MKQSSASRRRRGKVAETVGWLADKISIVELKIFHMQEQADRADVGTDFREQCRERLAILREQRDDLSRELDALVADIIAGKVVPKVYRQFKMYNDARYRAGENRPARETNLQL